MGDKSKNCNLRLAYSDLEKVEARARHERRTLSAMLRVLVLEALERDADLAAALAEAMRQTRADSPAAAVRALLSLAGDAGDA